MILVTGAAGKTGRAILHALTAKAQAVRALVRRADQAGALNASEIVVGDLRDESALRQAAHGVRAIYHICPNVHPDEVTIGKAIIDAARAAGVERFVYHSVLHPQTESMPHHLSKLHVEEMLFESGLRYTTLQPAPYMQNVLGEWQAMVNEGVYRVPYSVEAPFSPVDLDDVAEAAAIVLTEPNHDGATYELCGPEVLSASGMARVISRVLNRPVQAEQVPIEAWIERARATGMNDHAIDTLSRMFRYYDRFGLWGNARPLASLLGRAPTRFAGFIQRAARGMPD